MDRGESWRTPRLQRHQERALVDSGRSLRGINVGGHVVKKEKLQEAFTTLGFRNAIIYKQSGNVIFETDRADFEEIRSRIENKLRKSLGYDVAVFIRTIAHLRQLVESNSRVASEGSSLLVTTLPAPATEFTLPLPLTVPKSRAEIVSFSGWEIFSITHGGGEGALPNPFLESKLKVKTTTRNMNVIRDIVQRYDQGFERTP